MTTSTRGVPSLNALWRRAPTPAGSPVTPAEIERLPRAARRYLGHAIRRGAAQATAVRLHMRGEIRLKGWMPFRAEQVIVPAVGLRWQASVGRLPFRVSGYDAVADGRGVLRWRLLGLLPVMTAMGPDVDRAAVGRLQAELVWLPTALLPSSAVRWREDDGDAARVDLTHFGVTSHLRLATDTEGALRTVSLERWGDPDETGTHALRPFGARAGSERAFGDYMIPAELEVGWASPRSRAFEDATFFRCRIESATFRI